MTCDCKGPEQTCNLCQADGSITGDVVSEPLVPLQSSLAAEVEKKITVEELGEIFGEMIPMEAVDVLINPLASVRKHLREIAAKSKRPIEEPSGDTTTAEQQTIGLTPKISLAENSNG